MSIALSDMLLFTLIGSKKCESSSKSICLKEKNQSHVENSYRVKSKRALIVEILNFDTNPCLYIRKI